MRIALISDIHANLEAFLTVLSEIESAGIEEIICLGDIVGYGPNPNECINLVKEKCSIILLGNHDAAILNTLSTQNFNINARIAIEWTINHLTQESLEFLKELNMIKIIDQSTYVHATPYEPQMWYYITSAEEAAFNFKFFDTKYCFVGHTHIPVTISLDNSDNIYVTQETVINFDDFEDSRFLVNIGSIGQPRDRNPKAAYGVFDTDELNFSLYRLEYDVSKCQEKMKKNKLPEFLINRIAEGK